ncbi:MAG: TIGR00282 family metallophosphoesterase [Candidatus Omnitrophica bacterium]|nr:TIGR00282 family metallophosphoesterase [Candidatus Omnitrophota bacterium]
MKILCIGDIVGKPGRLALNALLEKLIEQHQIDFVIANGENTAGGSGITARLAKYLFRCGCDVITLGDHVWDQKEIEVHLDQIPALLRPANLPPNNPGNGWCIVAAKNGTKVAVINLLGRVFMRYHVPCPFYKLDEILEKIKDQADIIIVDFHAETTSEKVALGHYADGRVSAVVGTHTHIQTADHHVLAKGTAYITDLGMTGPHDSVIGQNKKNIIERFKTCHPVRFCVAQEDINISGALIQVDESTGKADNIELFKQHYMPDRSEKEAAHE